jgi:hypothetical protein
MLTRRKAQQMQPTDTEDTAFDTVEIWVSTSFQAGVDVTIVSERLGHASATITWDIYQHVTPAMQSDAAERVASLIFRPKAGS